MKKKQKNLSQSMQKKKEEKLSLQDQVQGEVFSKLKDMKAQLLQAELKAKDEEAAKAKEEKRLKEKNKSFQEMFEESNQNWKEFK
ncbi:YqkE family protein [Sutcliffiella deserti]|uniref:YqkE family protein n=1 Tax=Sutcliffiella deserti TaxID=2875501 RepID=UPI001CBD705E|nr:YqkE family protein [Sutcliffiella deserti]